MGDEVANNRKAYYDYEILEKIEAGIVLCGSEVTSLRGRRISLSGAYAGLSRNCISCIFRNTRLPIA